MKNVLALVVLVLTLSACGGDNLVGPKSPPSPSPVVSFAGTWSGSYTITACGHNGDFRTLDFCGTFSKGTELPMSLTLTQTGSSVTGTLSQHDLHTSVTGSVDGEGHLVLSGSTSINGLTITTLGWSTGVSGNALSGSWGDKFSSSTLSGFAQITNTINSVVKTSAAGATTLSAKPLREGATLQDVFDAMRK